MVHENECKGHIINKGGNSKVTSLLHTLLHLVLHPPHQSTKKKTFYTRMSNTGNLWQCPPRIGHKRNILWPEANSLNFLPLLKLVLLLKCWHSGNVHSKRKLVGFKLNTL